MNEGNCQSVSDTERTVWLHISIVKCGQECPDSKPELMISVFEYPASIPQVHHLSSSECQALQGLGVNIAMIRSIPWQLSLKCIRVLVILTATRYTPSFNTAQYWHCPGDWLNVIISAILSCFRHDSLIYCLIIPSHSVWDTVYSLNEPSSIQLNGFWRLDGRRKETLEREYIILLVSKR